MLRNEVLTPIVLLFIYLPQTYNKVFVKVKAENCIQWICFREAGSGFKTSNGLLKPLLDKCCVPGSKLKVLVQFETIFLATATI
jgi:hypothetical protein